MGGVLNSSIFHTREIGGTSISNLVCWLQKEGRPALLQGKGWINQSSKSSRLGGKVKKRSLTVGLPDKSKTRAREEKGVTHV